MKRFFESLIKIESFFIVLFLISLVSLTVINVILRYFFNLPIQWTEEIQVALFVWLTFASMGIIYNNGSFISVDIIDIILNKNEKTKAIFLVFSDIFIFIVLVIVAFWAIQISIAAKVKVTNILRIPYTFIDISLALGSLSVLKNIFLKYLRRNKQ